MGICSLRGLRLAAAAGDQDKTLEEIGRFWLRLDGRRLADDR